jgi:outer membrane immunogenic protein
MDWFGTLRGRLGFAVHNHLLLYGTGGLAYARTDHNFFEDCVSCQNNQDLGPISVSHTNTKAGWTVGGGGEFIHDERWLVRAEALYVDLGSETYDDTLFPPGGGSARVIANWDDQFWVARLGVAYKFGEREHHVVPLK